MSESDSYLDNSHIENKKKRKKGVSNSEFYNANIIKKSKVKGLPHKNYSGKEMTERQTGLPCK